MNKTEHTQWTPADKWEIPLSPGGNHLEFEFVTVPPCDQRAFTWKRESGTLTLWFERPTAGNVKVTVSGQTKLKSVETKAV